MVYTETPYETELTSIPGEITQIIEMRDYCLSKCKLLYPRITTSTKLGRLPKIDNEIQFD